MMSTTTAIGGGRNPKFPFTATQWQELEHQALIYKYMTAGIPIPPDLLFTIKRSLDSSLSSKFFTNYHPTTPLGWNAYNQIQMGYGKKIDPEPGRCRRTDGKKWRCSKEAYPDSKYCERHMHRGKNRSRKPVEITNPNFTNFASSTSTSSNYNNNYVTVASSSATNNSLSSPKSASLTHQSLMSTSTTSKTHPIPSLYSLSSLPSSDPPATPPTLTPTTITRTALLERYLHGLKEEVGEHAFFTVSSGLCMKTIDESWLGGYNNPNHDQMKQQEKQCYIWGRDFNCDLSIRVEEERENNDKTIHHFFDEWPLKAGGGGASGGGGGGGRDSSWHESPSTTQLSISIPSSSASLHHHDFFLSNSRTHHHDG